jgi:hypothetical protein
MSLRASKKQKKKFPPQEETPLTQYAMERAYRDWEGEMRDPTTPVMQWRPGHGEGRYRLRLQPLPEGSPWLEIKTNIVKDERPVLILGCLNDKDIHRKFSELKGVTIYTEEPIVYPLYIAESTRCIPPLPLPVSGYVYKIEVQLSQGYNTIAWCIHSPISYKDGNQPTRFPTLYMPGKEGYTQKTYGLNANPPPSTTYSHRHLESNSPMPYVLGRPGPPYFLTTLFPIGYTPSLVFLSTLADSHFQQKMEEKGYKKPGHFQYHNQLLWVQAQNIINILPPHAE